MRQESGCCGDKSRRDSEDSRNGKLLTFGHLSRKPVVRRKLLFAGPETLGSALAAKAPRGLTMIAID